MLKAILFDFNATLIRSPEWIALEVRELPRRAFAYLASEGHIDPLSGAQLEKAEAVFREARLAADESYRETSHVDDLTAMVSALGLQEQAPPSLIEETVATLHRQCVPRVRLEPHAQETLQHLQRMSLRLGIISNAAYAPFLKWTFEHFDLLNFFEEVIVSADVRTRKPGLDIFRIALERMGLSPPETVYVGDDYIKDVVASKKIGLRAIWYRPDEETRPSRDQTEADAIVTDHAEIPDLIKAWIAA